VASRVVEVTLLLPLSIQDARADELEHFAEWVARPISGPGDPRIPALLNVAGELVQTWRREVRRG
jgi:hypothetical protein